MTAEQLDTIPDPFSQTEPRISGRELLSAKRPKTETPQGTSSEESPEGYRRDRLLTKKAVDKMQCPAKIFL